MLKKPILIITLLVFIFSSGCAESGDTASKVTDTELFKTETVDIENSKPASVNYVDVKYRETKVNIAAPDFEYLNTDASSFVRGAWYDQRNQYMVINLSGVYYHYCGMPKSIWNDFKQAESFGSHYNQYIKNRYDCRQGYVPEYP